MKLNALHLILTYGCTYECEHCFVWGSPLQKATMTIPLLETILAQADQLGTVEWIYFEGGEPFLYYALLREGVEMCRAAGFRVGIVSNAYWAVSEPDALNALRDWAGKVHDLSLSGDSFHAGKPPGQYAINAYRAARALGIPCMILSVIKPGEPDEIESPVPLERFDLMCRGRAVQLEEARQAETDWRNLTECDYENLRNPKRVHLDPGGHVHLCQGILAGNFLTTPLAEIVQRYDPMKHPISSAIIEGGPAELAIRNGVSPQGRFLDCCHLCYRVREEIRSRYEEILGPDQVYGASVSELP